jgi:UDP-N-acetylglucosamine--N-acetylmuramyl-(pentapeptide) pyrophosphoryl-undecaprenol N-acetylglucosamine transferase
MNKKTVLFAAAGTAGHVEPALAVARWVRSQNSEVNCVFVGTHSGVENSLVEAAGFELKRIEKAAFPREINLQAFTWIFRYLISLLQADNLVKDADVVVGFGGYVAASTYLVAKLRRKPIIIHEANVKPGMANRLGNFLGGRTLVAFNETEKVLDNVVVVGIPLRPEVVELAKMSDSDRISARTAASKKLGFKDNHATVAIFGGSLGSVKFNSVIEKALPHFTKLGIQVIHSVGRKNSLPNASENYFPYPYIDDMASVYAASDLVIARGGAVSVFETGALGIFTLYVPLPIGNGEQLQNAQIVTASGGGMIIENSKFTSEWLSENLSEIMSKANTHTLSTVRTNFPLDADAQVGRHILELLR